MPRELEPAGEDGLHDVGLAVGVEDAFAVEDGLGLGVDGELEGFSVGNRYWLRHRQSGRPAVEAVEKLGAVNSLIIDLRGNTGGGIGALRVMSMITPGRVPVGFALDRRRLTANLESEKHSFHRFSQIPSSTKTLWLLALQFGPAMMKLPPSLPVVRLPM